MKFPVTVSLVPRATPNADSVDQIIYIPMEAVIKMMEDARVSSWHHLDPYLPEGMFPVRVQARAWLTDEPENMKLPTLVKR